MNEKAIMNNHAYSWLKDRLWKYQSKVLCAFKDSFFLFYEKKNRLAWRDIMMILTDCRPTWSGSHHHRWQWWTRARNRQIPVQHGCSAGFTSEESYKGKAGAWCHTCIVPYKARSLFVSWSISCSLFAIFWAWQGCSLRRWKETFFPVLLKDYLSCMCDEQEGWRGGHFKADGSQFFGFCENVWSQCAPSVFHCMFACVSWALVGKILQVRFRFR